MDLASQKCKPCQGGIPPLTADEIKALIPHLSKDWEVIDNHHLFKKYTFKNFKEAMSFTNAVGNLAEDVNHHPDILLAWGKVEISLWTHKINGLAEADFIFAAKVDQFFTG